jgi:hypothetical protein
MNHREPPRLPAGMRKALQCLSLLLVPAMTFDEGYAGPRFRTAIGSGPEPAPYLPVLGSLSMRVEEAPPPPELVTRPAAAAPPVPSLNPAETSVALANVDAARTAVTAPALEAPAEVKTSESAPAAEQPAPKTPLPILPDTARPVVHPEDFLPYFQIPGSARQAGDVNVIVPAAPSAPAPAAIPPSSATYTQSPR